VDATVVIEAMVVPALGSQFLQEILDHSLPPNSFGFVSIEIRCPACDIIMLTCDGLQRRDDAVADGCSLRSRGYIDLAETHQREMAERRHQAAFRQLDATCAGQPLRI